MKYGRGLNELAAEIVRQAEAKQDLIAPTNQLTVIPGQAGDTRPRLVVENTGEFPIRQIALNQMGERTGIPAKYVEKMTEEAPQLLADNLNHWFKAKPERRLVRLLDNDNRAFLSDSFRRVDHHDLLQTALPVVMDIQGMRVRSCEVTERKLYVKVTFDSLEREIKSARVGDVVRGGLVFGNSEVGHGSYFVSPWAEYLWCTNGAFREGGKRWAHIGRKIEGDAGETRFLSDETLQAGDRFDVLAFRDHLKAALDPVIFNDWIEKVQGTTERQVTGNVAKGVEVLGQKIGLTKGEGANVLRHLIAGGDLSQYGLYNAVTRTAEDAASYDRATEIEAIGQKVIDLNQREWRDVSEAA